MNRQPYQFEDFTRRGMLALGYYVFIRGPYSEIFTRRKRSNLIYSIIIGEMEKGMRVLEVGCSLGANILMINNRFKEAGEIKFYGVDASVEAIEIANEIAEWKGITGNCHFSVGDAEKLGYDDSQFDIVICTEVLEHLLQPKLALQEMHRVLKNGGLAIISTPISNNMPNKVIRDKLKDVIEKDANKRNPYEKEELGYGHISIPSSKELISMSEEAGFKVEKKMKQSLVHGWHFFDRHQIMFAIILILDAILDHLPCSYSFAWGIVLKLRKT